MMQLAEEWRDTVLDSIKKKAVDPFSVRNWGDVAFGWGLSKGLIGKEADHFVLVLTKMDLLPCVRLK